MARSLSEFLTRCRKIERDARKRKRSFCFRRYRKIDILIPFCYAIQRKPKSAGVVMYSLCNFLALAAPGGGSFPLSFFSSR
jgi:hypothetical protein